MKLFKSGAIASTLCRLVAAALLATLFVSAASAQLVPRGQKDEPNAVRGNTLALTITMVFNPSTVLLLGNSDATITVTNPNAFSVNNVQFNNTMPAGIDLITQLGGTCSTPATGGGMFTINPGTETFSSTSAVLTAGQSCTIIVRVRGTAIGSFTNTTSTVTATGAPPGGPASAVLTVVGLTTVSSITRIDSDPTLGPTVNFLVTFSASVTGVDAGDFVLSTTGSIAGASITGVAGSGATRTVTVNTGTGTGTIRLDVVDDDTIIDVNTFALGGAGAGNGNFATGEQYTVLGALAPTITKSFNPSTVLLLGSSTATITVTNPNSVSISNVQFSDTMPAGIDLITQVGGTCSTLATGGGMFSINPGTETFSSTSTVLTAGQSCTIIVQVQGAAIGAFVNTTSPVTATGIPTGTPASATLTVVGPPPAPQIIPALGPWQLAFLTMLLALLAGATLRRRTDW